MIFSYLITFPWWTFTLCLHLITKSAVCLQFKNEPQLFIYIFIFSAVWLHFLDELQHFVYIWLQSQLFVYVSLNFNFQIRSLQWVQADLYFKSPLHFIEMRLCVTFCCKRVDHGMLSLEFDKIKNLQFPFVGLMSLPKICTACKTFFASTFVHSLICACVKVW